jgi:hypothetical protein
VLAVSGTEAGWVRGPQRHVKPILASLPVEGWSRLRAGDGTNGPRWYDGHGRPLAQPPEPGWRRGLWVRRRVSTPPELQAYGVFAPHAPTREAVGRVAGSRWTIASGVAAAKGEVGLEHDEGRSGTGWHRQMTLAMWAYAWLVVRRAGLIASAGLKTRLPPSQTRSTRAALTAHQGRCSRYASPNGGGSCGGWSSRCRSPPSRSSRGPAGAVGISAWPNTITPNVVAHEPGYWPLNQFVTTVVLGYAAIPQRR